MSNIRKPLIQPTLATYLFDGGNTAPHDPLRPRTHTILTILESKCPTYPARLLYKISPANDNTPAPRLPTLVHKS